MSFADFRDFPAAQPNDDLQPVSHEEAVLLDQRLAAHEAVPEAVLTLEEFKRRFGNRP